MSYEKIPGLLVITGLMASGKSTVAQLLAERFTKSVHLRGDAFRRMIVNGAVEMSAQASDEAMNQLKLRYDISIQVALAYLKAGFRVVLQDNYYGEALSYIMSGFRSVNTRLFVLNPTLETIKRREAQRNKNGYHLYDIQALYNAFQRTTPRLGCWIDNSLQSPEETVIEILKQMN